MDENVTFNKKKISKDTLKIVLSRESVNVYTLNKSSQKTSLSNCIQEYLILQNE